MQTGGAWNFGMGRPLLLLWAFALVLLDLAHSQQCSLGTPPLTLRFADVGADQRVPTHRRAPGSMDPLYDLVQNYLDVIQQNPFPTGKHAAASTVESLVRFNFPAD